MTVLSQDPTLPTIRLPLAVPNGQNVEETPAGESGHGRPMSRQPELPLDDPLCLVPLS